MICCFFFNDTATTEIYTLSLHDALPILAIGVPMTVILPIIAVLSVTSEWSQRSGLATFTLVPHRGRVLLAKAMAVVLVDRKSTRLNSSHANISYAVFCLKKKILSS